MATTTMPPTTHALPHEQRLRLMRSTRKLGALLGETPLLVESILPSSFMTSHSRAMSTEPTRSGRLYLGAGQVEAHMEAAGSTPIPRPLLFGASHPFSLSLNSPSTPTAESTRRRRMAKLVRTLGENVPPELDVPFSYPSTVPYVPEGRSSSDSFVSASTHISTEQGWSGEWGGDVANMDDVVRNLRSLKLR
ncbi:hypothetical protein B0H13DRAFT_1960091 [Mycena leptocephala]|nr:hypothetical protein B0H13DRAFT_1960091 [Mycena leptocephala]